MKKVVLTLLIAMCVLFVACGKEISKKSSIISDKKESVISENQELAKKIIELAESYNCTNNVYDEEIGNQKYMEFFLEEFDEEAYQLILDDLEDKTGSAQKQVEKFYFNIDELFTEKCTTLELGVDDSVLFYYYTNLTKDYQKAYNWVTSSAIGGGVNIHSNQEGAAWGVGGDWVYYGEMTMYLPYYIYENLYTDKELSYKDMVEEIAYMDRSTSCLSQMDYVNDYENWNWASYEYKTVKEYIPMMEAMMWMGKKYDTFSGLSEHELFFSPSIVTPEDYWDYDWYSGTVTCAYVIHFYDKTANLYGEAGFTEDNKLMGISFWE